MDYITHWKLYSGIYALAIIYLFFLFTPVYDRLFTTQNMLFVASTILFCAFFYSRNTASALHVEQMSRYDYKYLTTKLLDVFMQQMVIYLLFYITNQTLVLFSAVFVLVHLHLFISKKFTSVAIFMVIALLLSFIFYTSYATLGANGFGVSYAVHMGVYLVGSKVFQFIYKKAF
jgi:hypothetical protein